MPVLLIRLPGLISKGLFSKILEKLQRIFDKGLRVVVLTIEICRGSKPVY